MVQQQQLLVRNSQWLVPGSFWPACMPELCENACCYVQHQNYDETAPI